MAAKQSVEARFAKKVFVKCESGVPRYSHKHGVIPRLYVQEWKTDMKNRELILKNADIGGIPHYELHENLFLEKREQLFYNIENRNRVVSKCRLPDREVLLHPPFHHETSWNQSELMMRWNF